MKKTYIIIFFLILSHASLFASHFMGGEILWECLPNGNYRFIMHVYRECQGCVGCYTATEEIKTNVPGLPLINISLYPNNTAGKKDISPTCNTNAAFAHINCFPAPTWSNTGAIEEFTYTTDANYPNGVNLPAGPIPAGGWYFAFSECCRNPCTNYSGSSSKDWWLRAVMYPYPAVSPDLCFDNSPVLGEKPATVICTKYPYVYNPVGMDKEFDSLNYAWSAPMESPSQTLTGINPGYSYSSPLPGLIQHPNNIPATVNPLTGEISFASYTSGAFMTCVRVTAYKCGIKVAEIFREHQLILLMCPPPDNIPPVVQAPFQNSSSGLYTEYTDTVHAGFAVDFDFSVADMQTQTDSLTLQNISHTAWGIQFGAGFSDDSLGCLHPPCATLSPPPSAGNPVFSTTHFHWQTDSVHLLPFTSCEAPSFYRSYDFIFLSTDDFCPVPAKVYTRIRIVVQNPQAPPVSAGMVNGPSFICAHGGTYVYSVWPISGATHYHWTLPPGCTGSSDSNSIVVHTNNAVNGNIYVYGSNAYGNGAASGTNLNVLPGLIPMPDHSIIPGSFAVLTALPTIGFGPFTFNWSNGMQGYTIPVSPATTTEYVVTITESSGCWQTDTVVVTVSGGGNVSKFALSADTVCAGLLRMPLYFSGFQNVDSLSLSFSYPSNVLNFLGIDSIHPLFNNSNLSVSSQNDQILIRWHSSTAVSFATILKVLNLKFHYLAGDAQLKWDVTQAGACSIYNSTNQACILGFTDGAVINGSCASLSGELRYANSLLTPMMNVNIQLVKNGEVITEYITDQNGHFQFSNIPQGLLTLKPHCNKPWGGVNAADALAILKHSTGLSILSGLNAKAADVNLSNNINAMDALFAARRYAGIITTFPLPDWIFTDLTIQVTDDSAYTLYPRALCGGDVNGSYIP